MQKASLGILAILLLCISCNFSPKKSQEAASTPEAVITSANTKPIITPIVHADYSSKVLFAKLKSSLTKPPNP